MGCRWCAFVRGLDMVFVLIQHSFNTEGRYGMGRVGGGKLDVVEKLKNRGKKSRNRLVSGFFVGARGGT